MSQNDLTIANQGFASFRSDLNSALQALGSLSSGTSAPSTTFSYQLWYDVTNNILKIRNGDNDAFINLFSFDQTNDKVSAFTIGGSITTEGGDNLFRNSSGSSSVSIISATNGISSLKLGDTADFDVGVIAYNNSGNSMEIQTNDSAKVIIDSAGNFTLPLDNQKLLLGASNDLQIYHDASHSCVQDLGTGDLRLKTNNTIMLLKGDSEVLAQFDADGPVTLKYDNTTRLATNPHGIQVDGYSHQTAPVVTIIHSNATTTINDNTLTNIPMQVSALDTHSLYDATNDRILIPSAFNGHYFLFKWAVTITGPGDNMAGHLYKNGATVQDDRRFYVGDEGESITFQGVYFATVATGDFFQVFGFSDKGSGSSSSVAGLQLTHIFATKLH